MSTVRSAAPYRLLLAGLLLIIPLVGCAALSSIQETQQDQDGTWVQAPINETDQAERSTNRQRVERNPRIRTVEVAPLVDSGSTIPARLSVVSASLREEGDDWIGTRYRYGGTTRRGIDCSAFVQTIMRDVLDVNLPRTTALQVRLGTAVNRDELLPADLVFFRRRGVRHVGIYLGDGEFIHASSSRGVTISNLTEGYYRRHFWRARRVVDGPPGFYADENLTRPIELGDMLRPGSGRSTDQAPDRSRTRNGNPRASW